MPDTSPEAAGPGSAVVGYVRAATATDPHLEQQERALRHYAEQREWDLVIVREIISVARTYKPMLEALIRDTAQGKYVGVIIHSKGLLGYQTTAEHYARRIKRAGAWLTEVYNSL